MRVIIAGSRAIDIVPKELGEILLAVFPAVTHIISGGARGVDTAAFNVAKLHSLPVTVYFADWYKHGKSAGYKRNVVMADNADALLAIWDGESRGTKHMIDIMTKLNKQVVIKQFNQ